MPPPTPCRVKIFSTIMNRHSTAMTIIFVNDPYDVIDSIKGEEHAKRNYVHGSKNVYIKAVDELQNKTNLSKNFTNKSNKIRSQNYLKMEFQRLSQSYPKKTFIYSVQRNCEDLKTGTKLPSYECNHQEADTIMFFIIHALRQVGNDSTIVIDAEDTDDVPQNLHQLSFNSMFSLVLMLHQDFSGEAKRQ